MERNGIKHKHSTLPCIFQWSGWKGRSNIQNPDEKSAGESIEKASQSAVQLPNDATVDHWQISR